MTGGYNACEISCMLGKGSENMLCTCVREKQQEKYGKSGPDFISFLQSWDLIVRQGPSFYRRQSDEFTHGHFHRVDFLHLVFNIGLAETLDLSSLRQKVALQAADCFIIIRDC
jgi:hypothetical protein